MAQIMKLDKYKIIPVILVALFIIIILSVLIISNVKTKQTDNIAIVMNEGDLAINYIDGNKININDKKEHEYNITITNISDQIVYYSLNIEVEEQSLNSTAYLYNEAKELVYETDDIIKDNNLVSLLTIEPSATVRYKLVMASSENSAFRGTIKVINDSMTTQTFADLILLNNPIKTPKTKIGLEISTIDEGLISSKDNYGTTYYFRGNVKDNYVQVGKLLFRVVRINGDGSVRLVLNDFLEVEYPYNINTLNVENIGESANLLNTSLITELNIWYQQNLIDYSNSLISGTFCTDITFETQLGDIYYSNTYNRTYGSNNPSLECQGITYNSNVGLLSVDEIIFAGAYKNTPNTEYYLYNKKQQKAYLTSSSYSLNSSNLISMININADGSLANGVLQDVPQAIRPVINIATSAKVKGKGTIQNPYIIVG